MSIFDKIFGTAAKGLLSGIDGVIGRFVESPEQRNQFKAEIASLVQQRDSELEQTLRMELESRAKIIEAEMAQGDAYTKRARPTIVYSGLVFVLAQMIGGALNVSIIVPGEFWYVWGGVCGVWIAGRSYEKGKAVSGEPTNKLTKLITG